MAVKRKKEPRANVIVKIHDLDKLSQREKHEIALYLRRLGEFVERPVARFASVFTARRFK